MAAASSKVRNAASAAISTQGSVSTRIDAQAARSNIQIGSSNKRTDATPS
jgi:hypothetical protein